MTDETPTPTEEPSLKGTQKPEEADMERRQAEQEPNMVERASKINDELKQNISKLEELTLRQEKATAQSMLGGKARAGTAQLSPADQLKNKAKEEADKIAASFGR